MAQLRAHGFGAGEAWDLPSLLAAIDVDQPTTVMIKSGIRDAPSLIKVGRHLGGSSAVVVYDLSLEREAEIVSAAETGVAGLILHTESFEAMLETLRTAGLGHAKCSTEVSAVLLRRVYAFSLDINPDASLDKLTARELEIVELIVQGLTNQQIASRLTLTLQTVKNHVHRLLGKMEVGSRAEVVAIYLAKHGGTATQDLGVAGDV